MCDIIVSYRDFDGIGIWIETPHKRVLTYVPMPLVFSILKELPPITCNIVKLQGFSIPMPIDNDYFPKLKTEDRERKLLQDTTDCLTKAIEKRHYLYNLTNFEDRRSYYTFGTYYTVSYSSITYHTRFGPMKMFRSPPSFPEWPIGSTTGTR